MADLKTVDHVDVHRYMGTWYEIARFPQRFEEGLVGISATYTLLPNGKVEVVNKGHERSLDGEERSIRGKAWVVDTSTNAKIKVRFFWPFSADYWIVELGENYEYAAVGGPSLKYLWILSRTPQMSETAYEDLAKRLLDKGFDVTRLEKVPQRQSA
jgi:lipocalin